MVCMLCLSCTVESETTGFTAEIETAANSILIENDDGSVAVSPDGQFLRQNGIYLSFANQVLKENPNGSARLIEAARLNSQAFDQTRYPQISPSVLLNEEGQPLARIGVSQILFSNGQFQAEKNSLRAGEIEALASYLIQANQMVADAFNLYFDAERHERIARAAQLLEAKFAELETQSMHRVTGGVGDNTEVATFSLRKLSARSDFLDNQARQKQAFDKLAKLTASYILPAKPPSLKPVKPSSEAPEVVLLMAQAAAAQSQVDLQRARRRPSFSVETFVDQNLASGESNNGATIGAGLSVPLGFRNQLGVEAAQVGLEAIAADLDAKRSDLALEISDLRNSIARVRAQIPTLKELAKVSKERTIGFEDQFLSGAVSIEEAVSVLETFNRAQTDLIEAEIEVLRTEVEIARLQGQLLPPAN